MGRGGSENRGSTGGASHRIQRVEREIREAVGSYLLGGFRGELQGFVSVSRVIASKDLRNAKVLVTVMGTEAEQKASVSELQARAHEVQQEVNRRLRMKYCPKLHFMYDEGFENVLKVEKILHGLSTERAKREGRDSEDNGRDNASDDSHEDNED